MKKTVLVTGGAGYIGSHTCVALHHAGYKVIILDNFCNSDRSVVTRLNQILGIKLLSYEGDVRDQPLLSHLFSSHHIDAVIHFAALKAVGDSVQKPLTYYDNNIGGIFSLLHEMKAASIYNLIFSSSATVYGNPKSLPLREDAIRSAMSPYGRSKLMIEDILEDLHHAEPDWNIARLRYFNPVGAHESGLIGELPKDIPNNLMPYIQQVAHGLQPYLKVFGDDYNTSDGTGIRDYVHVMDLAEGHVTALHYFQNNKGLLTVNLGTGKGTSVFELIKTFEEVNHCHVPYRVVARRKGDVAACWADVEYAAQTLQWKAKRDVSDMCKDSWRFECNRNQFSKE